MLSHLQSYRIVLGSQSPRRKELLSGLKIPFEVIPIDVEETYPRELVGVDIPCFLPKRKQKLTQPKWMTKPCYYRRYYCLASG
jgi:septum formation protein